MRLASFNVENLFERPAVMNLPDWAEGKPILERYARLCSLLESPVYTSAIKKEILQLAGELGIRSTGSSKYVKLNEVREKLFRRPAGKPVEVAAAGRGDWIGWVELVKERIKAASVANTARVVSELDADIIAIVEAEDRTGLQHFNEQALKSAAGARYRHVMLIDGNDERGIDVGIMSKAAYPIDFVRSHVDDRDGAARIFSRDCPEYCFRLASGKRLWVLVNHLKSKGYGAAAKSAARRKLQARAARAIAERLLQAAEQYVAVVGDFNDTPQSDALSPLLQEGSSLKDIWSLQSFDDGGRPGTHGDCGASAKLDYILLSPALAQKAAGAGVMRKGMWGGQNGTLWVHYPEVLGPKDVASDHAALWVDLDVS
jgi:endonuclease/exonuclease/phosphatase family metal-dependent hydrolase